MKGALLVATGFIAVTLAGCTAGPTPPAPLPVSDAFLFELEKDNETVQVRWDWIPGETIGALTLLDNGTVLQKGRFLMDPEGRVVAANDGHSIRWFYGEDAVFGAHPAVFVGLVVPDQPRGNLLTRAHIPPPAPGLDQPSTATSTCQTQCPGNLPNFTMHWTFEGEDRFYAERTTVKAPALNSTWTWTLLEAPNAQTPGLMVAPAPTPKGNCKPIPCEDEAWPDRFSLEAVYARIEGPGLHSSPQGRPVGGAVGTAVHVRPPALDPIPYGFSGAIAYYDDDSGVVQGFAVERYGQQVLPWSTGIVQELSPHDSPLVYANGPLFVDTDQGIRSTLAFMGLGLEEISFYAAGYADQGYDPHPLYAAAIGLEMEPAGLYVQLSGATGEPHWIGAFKEDGKAALEGIWQRLQNGDSA